MRDTAQGWRSRNGDKAETAKGRGEASARAGRFKAPGPGADIRNAKQPLNPAFRRVRTDLKRVDHDHQQRNCLHCHVMRMYAICC